MNPFYNLEKIGRKFFFSIHKINTEYRLCQSLFIANKSILIQMDGNATVVVSKLHACHSTEQNEVATVQYSTVQ